MKVKYKTKKLEKICLSEKEARKNYGEVVAMKLQMAINALEAAYNLEDIRSLIQYHLHPLKGDRFGQYSIYLGKTTGFRLILIPYDKDDNLIKTNDTNVYIKTVCVEIEEVSKHYE